MLPIDRFCCRSCLKRPTNSDFVVPTRTLAGRVMMGRISRDQGQLFYSFNLEEVVPDDHLARAIARVLDLSWVRGELAPHYSHTGRPSIHPVLMIRMLIILRVRDPLGTRTVPRGPAQPRLSLVLWPWH